MRAIHRAAEGSGLPLYRPLASCPVRRDRVTDRPKSRVTIHDIVSRAHCYSRSIRGSAALSRRLSPLVCPSGFTRRDNAAACRSPNNRFPRLSRRWTTMMTISSITVERSTVARVRPARARARAYPLSFSFSRSPSPRSFGVLLRYLILVRSPDEDRRPRATLRRRPCPDISRAGGRTR